MTPQQQKDGLRHRQMPAARTGGLSISPWVTRLIALIFLIVGADAMARSTTAVALGKWKKKSSQPTLVIPLFDLLTAKQRSMINGGFTTVSELTLALRSDGDEIDEKLVFFRSRCSVKYDAWDENYDVARLDDKPQALLVRNFDTYANLCLNAVVDSNAARNLVSGGTIVARLSVMQISIQESQRIKDWLVEQQSGVMQTLFSHMLGELSLEQSLNITVSVPPMPRTPASSQPAKRVRPLNTPVEKG